jgi:LmbE family N-acetylglucosaminyl deacetylase
MTIYDKIKNRFCKRKYLLSLLVVMAALAVIACIFYILEVPSVMAQSAVDSLPDVIMPQSGQRILVFSPHPDDETIGVGGYIAQSIIAGADVRIVLVTDGNFHHDEQVRYAEFKKATQTLGVPESNLVFLGFPDGKLNSTDITSLQTALKTQIDQYNPDIIIYPNINDAHTDHAAIGKAVEAVLKAEPRQRTVYEYLIHYKLIWPRPRQFAPDTHLSPPTKLVTADSRWETFPLSQTDENLKSEALSTYRSQNSNLWLRGLIQSFIRTNELLVVPQNIYAH